MKSIPQAGVYAISGPNGGLYIGGSENLRKREVFHWSLLRRGKHHATQLQEDYDTYGVEAITYRVLEYTTADLVGALEQRYLDNLFATHPRERIYNVTQSVDGATGRIATDEARRRMSAFQKGRKRTVETRRNMSEGRKGMKFEPGHVENIALGKSGGKRYVIIAPDGTEYRDVLNVTAFARDHGLAKSSLAMMACGKLRIVKGWTLRLQR